jgi:hypothetical protein
MPTTNPHREEILALLRRADCHYGNALRDAEVGLTVDEAADKRKVRTDRIVALRAAVRRVGDGEHSRTKAQAGHEDGVLRALLHSATRCPTGYVSTSTRGSRGSRRNSCPT